MDTGRHNPGLGGGLIVSAGSVARDGAEPGRGLAALADRIGMTLLLLATAALVVRPSDLVAGLRDSPIYEYLIVLCALFSLPRIVERLRAPALRENGVVALVLVLIPAVMLSHLSRGNTWDARIGGIEMVKACVFFLLIAGVVDSTRRLAALLLTVGAGVLVVAVLSMIEHYGVWSIPALAGVVQASTNPDEAPLVRLCGAGVFNDPNDFAMLLVSAICIGAYFVGERRLGGWRWALLAPLAVFLWAVLLTHSRGGLISGGAALLAFVPARVGWRNTWPLLAVVVPVALWVFAGRQTDLNLDDPEDTFQGRLELWTHAIDAFRSAPLFGVGQGKLVDTVGHVAHNSYLQGFAEMGAMGGIAFLGAFLLLGRGLRASTPADPDLARARPYMLALAVGYACGLMSLSRCYTVPTLMVLALGAAYLRISSGRGPVPGAALDGRAFKVVLMAGPAFLIATLVFVRVMQVGGGL